MAKRKMFAEDYLYLVKAKYEGKVIYCKDIQRVLEWEEVVEDYMTYGLDEYNSIYDYIDNNILSENSNCELQNK